MSPNFLKTALSFLVSFLITQTIFAGEDWKPITPQELSQKEAIVEPDADAEAIFWEVRIDDSSESDLYQNHYVRVKIFTERGREKYSKFDIPFYKGLKIKDLAARVIKPDGSIVEIDKKDIFEREIIRADKVKIKAKSFAVPGIEPGVIVEYRYRQIFQDEGATGMELSFQKDIPIQVLSYYYKPHYQGSPLYQAYNFNDTEFIKDSKGFYLARRRNIPSFKEESQMPPEDNVRPWMLLQNFGFRLTNATAFSVNYVFKDPTNPRTFWGAVSMQNAPLLKFMNKSDKEISKVAAEITAGATSSEEKLRKLYEFTQTQIKNTSFDTALTDEDRKKLPKINNLRDVLKNKAAPSQFIDMLFGAMANSLGFESTVAFAANRKKMFFEPSMTNEGFLHPACIAVKVDNKWKFYNPGMKFLPFGSLVWYEQDVWALLIGEKTYYWERTPLLNPEQSLAKRSGKFKLLEDGTLEGNIKIEFTGNPAIANRLDLYDETDDKRAEMVKNEAKVNMTTAEISEVAIENLDNISAPLIYVYKVRVPNYAQKTGKRLFLQPGFFKYGEKPTFSGASRKYQINFFYPWAESDDIEIALPKGFILDNADSPGALSDPQKIGSLAISISIAKDQSFLVYQRKFHFGGGGNILFPPTAYQPLKSMFDSFHKADQHAITLKQN